MYSLIKANYPLLSLEMCSFDVRHINRKYFFFFNSLEMFKFLPIIIFNLNKEDVFYNQLSNKSKSKKSNYLVKLYICETNEMIIHLESQREITPVLQKWLILIGATYKLHSQ